MGQKISNFLAMLMSATSKESSKRFVIVMTSIVFVAANVVCIILLIALFSLRLLNAVTIPEYLVKEFFSTFRTLLQYDLFVLSVGIFGIVLTSGFTSITDMVIKKAEAKVEAAKQGVSDTTVVNKTVQNQNIGEANVQEVKAE